MTHRQRAASVLVALIVGLGMTGGAAAAAAPDAVPPAPRNAPPAASVPGSTAPTLVDLDLALFPEMDLVSWEQVFAPWGDTRLYTLVAGGDAESGAGWDLSGGAYIGRGNEPWRVWDAADRRSVGLLTGASATLRTTDHFAAELRFFVQRTATSSAWLQVTVTARNADGGTATLTHRVDGSALQWAASEPLAVPDVRGVDGVQYLTITFQPVGWGSWRVDDVALDPWRAG